MLKEYPNYKKHEIENIFNKFSQEDKDLINKMIILCSDTNSEPKLKKIKRHIIQLRHVTEKPFNKINNEDLKLFFHLLKRSRSPQTIQEIHWQVKKFCIEILNNYEIIKNIKVKKVRGIDLKKYSETNLITKEDVEKMGRHALNYRDKAFLFVSFYTGARPSEILNLTWDQVIFNDKYAIIKLFATKNQKQRDFPVPPEVKKVLWDWKQNYSYPNLNHKKDFIFPSPNDRNKPLTTASTNKILRQMSKKSGINKDVWNYMLRHSRSQKLYEELPVPIVEKLMAHKDMYRIYSEISNQKAKEQLFEKIYKIEELNEQEENQMKKQIEDLKQLLNQTTIRTNEQIKIMEDWQDLALKYMKITPEDKELLKSLRPKNYNYQSS